MLITPVLYWMYNSTLKVVPSSDKYKERVHTLDNTNSSDKSILLKNVMWADSGKYLCKLSITTEDQSFRKKGNETLLIIHGKCKVWDFLYFQRIAVKGKSNVVTEKERSATILLIFI